jgi:predicted TIM-barrel fold metal-dependent hydrolase
MEAFDRKCDSRRKLLKSLALAPSAASLPANLLAQFATKSTAKGGRLAALLKFAPESNILFGTDFFPEPIESTVNELPTSGLSAQLMRAIERSNAERLFPRFKVSPFPAPAAAEYSL